GAQGLVAVDDLLAAALQQGDVEPTADANGGILTVGDAVRGDLPEHPHALLAGGGQGRPDLSGRPGELVFARGRPRRSRPPGIWCHVRRPSTRDPFGAQALTYESEPEVSAAGAVADTSGSDSSPEGPLTPNDFPARPRRPVGAAPPAALPAFLRALPRANP